MNWQHFKTYIWLRWRLTANLNKRQGLLVTILVYLLLVFFALGGLAALTAGFLLGNIKMASLPTHQIMTIWEMMVLFYLTFWLVGLMAELQRSDILSLDKFLPLPVTPAGAFLINYLGSSISLTLVMFLALMGGIALGLLVSLGMKMFLLVLLVVCFFLMVTAVTYQFRGWLTLMMTTPRRRQAILSILGIVFFIIFMSPPLMVMYQKATRQQGQVDATAVTTGQGSNSGATVSSREIKPFRSPITAADRALLQARFQLVNYIFPPGWLAVGAVSTLQGRYISAIVTMLGMLLIGIWSLMRCYRTTLRMYKGNFDSRPATTRTVSAPVKAGAADEIPARSVSFLELRLPWISHHVSAIALASLRARMRTTQAKLMFIFPVILLIIFSGFFRDRVANLSEFTRSLTAAGIAAFVLFSSMTYTVGNLFGYDRGGFRVYVLSHATRRNILLGKNLSLFPLAFSLMLFSIFVVNWFVTMRPDHLLAVILQAVPLYLILCIYGNQLSILLPMVVRNNGMPASGQNVNILVRELTGLLMIVVLTVTFIPLGIEYIMSLLDWHTWFPAYLFFMIVETGLVIWLYSAVLDSQAELLYQREQRILEVVTTRVE